jgi:hypothetical protein
MCTTCSNIRRLCVLRGQRIVAYLLRASTLELEIQSLLANGSETTFASRQRPRKKVERRPLPAGKFLIRSRPLLGNGLVNTFLRQRMRMQQRNGVSVWSLRSQSHIATDCQSISKS